MPRTSLASSLSLLVVVAGCTSRNPDARLDFAVAPRDLALVPRDLSPPPPAGDMAPSGVQLTNGGMLESVATDQSRAAFLPSLTTSLEGHVGVGTLEVMTLPYGAPQSVADNVYGAAFQGTSTLFYSLAPTPSADSGATAIYGSLGVWKPGWSSGVTLSRNYVVSRVLAAGYALFWDVTSPSTAGTGDLVLVRVSDCDGKRCPAITLTAGAQHVVSLAGAGSHAAWSIKSGNGYDVWLADVNAGTAAKLGSGGSSGSISFSSDGALLAYVGAGGSLQVCSTSDGSVVAWAALPAGARAETVAFADAATLVVRALPVNASKTSAYATSAAGAHLVAADVSAISVLRSGAGGTTHWLFAAGAPDGNGLVDVGAYDLAAANPTRIPVAQATSLPLVALGFDQTLAWAISSYDARSATGQLQAVALPGGTATTLDGAVGPGDVSFAASSTVVWIAHDRSLHGWHDGVATAYAGGVNDFRTRGGPSTIYFTVGAVDPIGGYAPGIWFTSLR